MTGKKRWSAGERIMTRIARGRLRAAALLAAGTIIGLPLVGVPAVAGAPRVAEPPAAAPIPRVGAPDRFDPRRPLARELDLSIGDGFTLAAVGDCIITRPLSSMLKNNEGFAAIVRVLREAGAAFGNIETPLIDIRSVAASPQGSLDDWAILADPAVAKDLKNLGFDLLSRANNHALDWGVEGMRETTRWLDDAGLVHAGVGANRAEARGARYLETEQGRVALVSMASTYRELSDALPPLGEAPGRPGLNALRTTRTTVVTEPMMRALLQVKSGLDAAAGGSCGGAATVRPLETPDGLTMFDNRFQIGKRADYHYEIDPIDLQENLKAIRQGKQHADFLVATIHAHEAGLDCDQPGDFLRVLAHAALEAGADAFLVHGSHQLGPIEIDHGRLIAYGLGNFFWSDIIEPLSPVVHEQNRDAIGLAFPDPAAATDADLNALMNSTSFNDAIYFQSVVLVSRYDAGRLAEVRLIPVDLGYGTRLVKSGVPNLASPAVARVILDRLARLSKPYGTNISIERNVGVIRPAPPSRP